jgi:ABC-type Fe3+/spermidine/putrescine transport system ATPase subunit
VEERARRVEAMLALVELAGYGERFPRELSGGLEQRVAVARALAFQPALLLMDEPLGALDRSLRDQLQTEIKRIQRDLGVTVLYVTHDQEEALALSDRIAVMAEGKICQLATPDEIYENPASAFVAGFVGESNFIDVTMRGQDGPLATVVPAGIPGALFTATTSPAAQPAQAQAVMAIRPEALRLATLQDTPPSNAIPGRVALREFMGATVRLTIDTELGPMIVRDGRVSEAASFKVGDTVRLSWNERDALLFPPR